MIFWVTNRWGQQKDCIGDVVEAIHKDEVNGEDSLTLVLTENRLIKGDRVVWKDRFGDWHEHIANEATRSHSDGALLFTFYCENSLAETMGDYVEEIVQEGKKAAAVIPAILANSRWAKGNVDDFGNKDYYLFNSMAYDGIRKAVETWGGELSTRITVSGDAVSQRLVDLKARRGHDDGKLFTYGHDMSAVEQTVAADDVVTRLHVFGKGTGNGDPDAGYTERLTFESINNGKDYVEDNDAKLAWGLPDGNGGVKHAEGVAIFEDCEDETELLALGNDELDRRKHPHVSYRATVATLSDYGYEYDDARPGDTVYMRDEPLDLRLEGRVTCITRYLVNTSATVIEMGDSIRSITDVMGKQLADLEWLRARSSGWDAASLSNAAWLDRFIDHLNAQFDAAGGYVNIDPETGITVVDDPTNPTMAIQINGMGFRIANQKNSNGTWKWRTMGTGAGLVADEIVTGVLHCGTNSFDLTNGTVTLANGLIQDTASANYWNLGTGEMRLASTITVGGSTVSSIASDAVSTFVNGTYATNLAAAQSQIDQKIETWHQASDPSTAWTTNDAKAAHKGDLWYDTSSSANVTKRYDLVSGTYKWVKQDAPKEVFDAIDGKAQIFVSTPTPPYNVGDLWFNSTTSDIMTCITARATGSYTASDWQKRNKYTDDSALESFLEDYIDDIDGINGQLDLKVETWYQSGDPSTNWSADQKIDHFGDLWFKTANGENTTWRWNGTGWMQQNAPKAVFDKIDGKAAIFTGSTTPASPSAGDLWFKGADQPILTYVGNQWVEYNKYTDDTRAETAETNAKNYADGKDAALETTLKSYADSVSAGQLSASKTYAEYQDAALLASLTQAEVLKRLTNDGAAQGIYMTNGQLYINGSYINTGTIDAGIIRAGILMDSQSNNYWNMATGYLSTTSGFIGGFTIGQSAIYNGLSSLTGQTAGIYLGTNGIACATSYTEDNATHSHSIAFSGGGMEGRYDGSVVGYITPNATATGDDGNGNQTTLHGLQMRGGVIDLRTAHLTVYDANSASGTSTHTITETDETIAANPYYGTRITPASYTNNVFSAYFKYTYPKFINGLYVGQAMENYSGSGSNAINFATQEYVDAAITALETALKTWSGQQGYLTSVPSHTHSYTSDEITNKPTIPSFTKSGSTLYITT